MSKNLKIKHYLNTFLKSIGNRTFRTVAVSLTTVRQKTGDSATEIHCRSV